MHATSSGLTASQKRGEGTGDLIVDAAPLPRSKAPNRASPMRPQRTPSKLRQDLRSPSRASSDKENFSPFEVSSSPSLPSTYSQTRTPSRSHQTSTQPTFPSPSFPHFACPLTPKGLLSLPPKRKRARVDKVASSRAEEEVLTARKDFTIREDQLAEALTQLSPDVERHRKGRGPRRARCMSYWDEDILQTGSQCVPMDVDDNVGTMGEVKQVLGK